MSRGFKKKTLPILGIILLFVVSLMPVFAKGITPGSSDESVSVVQSDEELNSSESSEVEKPSAIAASTADNNKSNLNKSSALATAKVKLSVGELDDDSFVTEKSDFYTDEPIACAVDLDVSGKDTKYSNAKLVVKVEKKSYITKPTFASSNLATSSDVSEDDNFYIATYAFEHLSGGQHITIPFPFKFDATSSVKTGDKVKVSSFLYANDNETPVANNEKIYTAKTSKICADYHPYHKGYKYDWDNHIAYAKVPVNSEDATTMEPGYSITQLQWPGFYVDRPEGLTGIMGTSKPTNVKVVMHLPTCAKLANENGSWKYVDETKTSIYTKLNFDRWPDGGYKEIHYKPGWIRGVDLVFTGAKLNEKIPITADFWIDADLDSEYKVNDAPIASYYVFEPQVFKGEGGTGVYRDGNMNAKHDKKFHNYIDDRLYFTNGKAIYCGKYDVTTDGMFQHNKVENWNNGSSSADLYGGVRSNIYEMTTSLIEDGEYFTRVYLWDVNSNIGENKNLEAMKKALQSTDNTLYGIKDNGEKEVIARNIKTNTYIDIHDTHRKYKAVSLVFASPICLDHAWMRLDTYTSLTEKELSKFDVDGGFYNGVKPYFSNLSVVLSEGVNPDDSQKTTRSYNNPYNYVKVSKISPVVKEHEQQNQTAVYKTGGTPLTYLVGYNYDDHTRWASWGDIKEFNNVKTITLLPSGIEYNGQDNPQRWKELGIKEPEIVENYKGTGKTAVIVDYGKIPVTKSHAVWFNLLVTKNTKRGNNDVVTYMVYDHNDVAKPYNEKFYYTDALDLDDDGDLNETFMQYHSTINFIPALELILHKDGYYGAEETASDSVIGDMGSDFTYRLSVFNNAVVPCKFVSVIDILPYKGDKVTVPNNKGEYKDRHSTFVTGLTGPLEDVAENEKANSMFDFYYQTDRKDTIKENRDGKWYTKDEISDFSKVTGFKAVLKDGKQIATKEEVLIYVPSRIPYEPSMNPEVDQSVNSAAFYQWNRVQRG